MNTWPSTALEPVRFASDLVLAPASAFRRLSPSAGWAVVLVGVAALAALVHAVSVPFTIALVRRLAASANPDAVSGLERWLLAIAFVRAAWVMLKAAFICWILWLTLGLQGESVSARRLMVIAAFASVALVAEDALRFVVFWLRGIDQIRGPQDLQSFTGLDAFVSTSQMGMTMRLLLAQLSLFSFWFVTIVRGGLVGFVGMRPRSATVTALLCWFYLLLVQLGMAFVVSSIQGGAGSLT